MGLFLPVLTIFPHLIFSQYTPSLHFQVSYICDEAQAAPELVQGPPSNTGTVLCSRGTSAQGRRKGRSDEGRPISRAEGGFRVSSRFPTSSLASASAPSPASAALPPKPWNCQGDGKRQGWSTASWEQG